MPEFIHCHHNGKNAHGTYEILLDECKKNLGYAELIYCLRPIPCYVLSTLQVEEEFQRQGFGTRLLDFIESYLKKMDAPGLLFDPPYEPDEEHPDLYPFVSDWYTRRGWSKPNKSWHRFYNLSADVDPKIFDDIEQVYADF